MFIQDSFHYFPPVVQMSAELTHEQLLDQKGALAFARLSFVAQQLQFKFRRLDLSLPSADHGA